MNIVAIAEFYLKHHDDIAKIAAKVKALVPSGGTTDPSLTNDLIGLVNKHFPEWNPNRFIEDTLALVKDETTAELPAAPRDMGAVE